MVRDAPRSEQDQECRMANSEYRMNRDTIASPFDIRYSTFSIFPLSYLRKSMIDRFSVAELDCRFACNRVMAICILVIVSA